MRFTFTIEIPDNRGSHENTHTDFFKAALKQMEETLSYANSKEGKRLMAKLKDKAGCSELELIEECWEAADENLGRKSNAVVGSALTASPSTQKSDPFSKVTAPKPKAAPAPVVEEAEEEEEAPDAPVPAKKPLAKFPVKKTPAPVEEEPEEEVVVEEVAEEEAVEEEAVEEIEEEVEEELEEEAEEAEEAPAAPARPAAKKFPFKKLPHKTAPVPEQQELLSDDKEDEDEEVEEEEAAEPAPSRPAKAPFQGAGLKRPAKGMTGFAKKGSPFKKMPFKKLPPRG